MTHEQLELKVSKLTEHVKELTKFTNDLEQRIAGLQDRVEALEYWTKLSPLPEGSYERYLQRNGLEDTLEQKKLWAGDVS